MVNTRKKGKKQDCDSTEACQPEVVDLSGESETSNTSNSVRRSSRRSVGSSNAVQSKDPLSTPIRRSRRLSTSSVESVTIDSPIPVSTRRSVRGKHTASVTVSDSEDGDSNQAAKKRKVTDLVDTLTAIDEEKTESEVQVVSSNPVEIIDLDLKDVSSLKKEDKDVDREIKATDLVVVDIKGNEGQEQAELEVAQESCDKFSKEIIAESKETSLSHDIPVQETNMTGKCEKKEELEESTNLKEKENIPGKPAKFTKGTEDSKLQLEKLAISNPLNKKQKQKNTKTPKSIVTSKPPAPEIKPLPCGAEIMKSIPRGRPKSGRLWKDPKSNPRYMYKDKGLKMPFEKITQLREERKRVKDLENRMKEEERLRREDLKRRKEINKQRQEENAKKGEIVQVIRNTAKLKRMSKKQLRQIQKRDTEMVK